MNVDAPAPRDYGQETAATLQAQVDLAPKRFAAESQFSPQYADLSVANLRRTLLGNGTNPGLLATVQELAPQLQGLQSANETAQRERDIAAVEALGGRAVNAFRNADPQQAALLSALNQQAQGDLAAGAALSPAEAAQLEQQVRSSQASRGFGFSLPDAVLESYTIGDRGRQLQNERRAFAGNVAKMNAATGQDPFMAILGRPSQASSQGQALLGQGQQQIGQSGPGLFNPESAYASDVANTNYNGAAAANIASANANSAIIAGGLSAL
jgi:hypothetical protein